MSPEELDRLEKGKKLMQKIDKLKAFLQNINKINLRVIYTPISGSRYSSSNADLESLTGAEFIRNRVVGDIALAVREEIVRLEEEFKEL